LGDTRTPVLVGFVTVGVNVVLALLLMFPLRHTGLALASSLSSYVNVLGLCWLLHRRLGGPRGAALAGSLGRTLAASAGLALWCAWVEGLLPAPPEPLGPGLGRVLLALVGGVVVYGAGAAAMRAPELAALRGMLRRGR
jgi:putative peptidoglycan lipid II flippase